ncbi:cellobiose transport system substrate-binding protein [Nocardioides aromaticivorans]|uniref:Cellobiose transport system substrate-binding protein n=1 Tax=Nocardioides aromaticivorans TaxID=200618 RepID=A0A7Y9ZL94_9ACTN|nr:extracellular solute-binding protein [Nocardioides aromaticivorans]NYI46911.1 cellobiose transport system substrate-binding protein [Nocardioides aromaticivorans]
MHHTTAGPRRSTRLIASAAVASLVLTMSACGSSDDPTKSAEQEKLGKGEALTITTFGEFGYDALIEEWNADHPDIQVQQTKVSLWDDWKNELNTNLQAGSGLPDVVAIEGDFMPALVAAPDRWVDLSSDEVEGRWLDFKEKAATTADGALLGYATDAGPEAICYRADLFAKAGLPTDRAEVAALMTTWDDYFALGEKFVKAVPDTAWYDASGSIAQAMLNQVAFPFEQSDNTVDVENDELRGVYDTVTGYTPTLSTKAAQWGDDWSAGFKNDGFATIPCPGWMRSNIKDNTGDPAPKGVRWDIADVFPGGGGNWGGSYLAVPKSSTHQDEAQEFITWITAPEQQLKIFASLGNFPSQVAALEDAELLKAKDPYFNDAPAGEIFSNRAAAIDVQPYHGPLYSDILGKFQDAINRVDQGTDPKESWDTFLSDVAALQ